MRARRTRRFGETLSQLQEPFRGFWMCDIDRQSRAGLADRRRRPSDGWTLIASYQVYRYSSGGMAPFNANIWDLIHEGGWKYVLTTFEKGRTFFLKKIVAVDAINQGHNGGRAPATFAGDGRHR